MFRRFGIIFIVAAFSLALTGSTLLAQDEKAASRGAVVPPIQKGQAGGASSMPMPPRMAFGMVSGKIEKIDASDPANIKLDVKSDVDGKVHNILVTQTTNINKVTDASELKAGDAVRVMSRSSAGKEIAIGVMFGKLRPFPAMRMGAGSVPGMPKGAVKAVKQESAQQ